MKTNKKFQTTALGPSKKVLIGLFGFAKDVTLGLVDPYARFHDGFTIKHYPKNYQGDHKYSKKQVYKAVQNLREGGYITSVLKDGKTLYELSEKGMLEIEKEKLLTRVKSKKLDGKWRVVIFDIPESERALRHNFRKLLREFNFKILQASVWVTPFDVFDELEQLVPDIKKHNWIKLLLVETIVGESEFEKLFD